MQPRELRIPAALLTAVLAATSCSAGGNDGRAPASSPPSVAGAATTSTEPPSDDRPTSEALPAADTTADDPSPPPEVIVAETACPAGATDQAVDAAALVAAACATEAAATVHFEITGTSGRGFSLGAAGAYDTASQRADVRLRRQGREVVHYLVDGDTVFLTSPDPQVTSVLPEGRQWVTGSAAQFGALGLATAASGPLPVHLLVLGATGVRTQEGLASFTVDPAAVLAHVPPGRLGDVSELAPFDDPELTLAGTAVLGADGRLTTVNISGSAAGGPVRWVATLGRYEDPVSIAPPPSLAVAPLDAAPQLPAALAAAVS